MKTRIFALFTLLVSVLSVPVHANDVDHNFDIPAASLFKLSLSQADYPDAGAVIIRQEQAVHVKGDGSCVDVVRLTAKIFNERGRSYSDVSVSFNALSESITAISARTLLPNGTILPIKNENIYLSRPYADYALYSDAVTLSFSMPGVEDGAIIDMTYTVHESKPQIPKQFSEHWPIRDTYDPVLLSRYIVTAPVSMPLQIQSHNTDGIQYKETLVNHGKDKTYTWEMDDLPTITPEPLMPDSEVTLPWLEVSTIPSWQNVAQWYDKLVTPQMKANKEIKDIVQQLTQDKKTDTEKAQALFYWVESKTRYVAIESGLSAVQPHPAPDVFRNRYGDCKDMATLLLTMLHEAGIKTAWPVLLAAGSQRSLHDGVPQPDAFDHAIVRADIDGKPLWFDCTAEMASYGAIPGSDRGADALVIRDGIGTFETIPLSVPSDNVNIGTTKVVMQPDGSADCVTDMAMTGDLALLYRRSFRNLNPDQVKQAMQNIVRTITPNATLTTFSMVEPDKLNTDFRLHLSYHAPIYAIKTGSLLIIPTDRSDTQVFSLPERHFPISQKQAIHSQEDLTVTLPVGYVVDDKPADMHLSTAVAQVDIVTTVSDTALTRHKSSDGIVTTVSVADYPKLKSQMESLSANIKQPIVLRLIAKDAGDGTKSH